MDISIDYERLESFLSHMLPGDPFKQEDYSDKEYDYLLSQLERIGWCIDLSGVLCRVDVCEQCDGEGVTEQMQPCRTCDQTGWCRDLGAKGLHPL